MLLSGHSRLGGPAALITTLTLIMLGAITFALPPSRISVTTTGVERGVLVSQAGFSSMLAANIAATGYNYLCVDLTTADPGEGDHWARHLETVNEVQFAVWGWLELKGEWELEAVRQAQVAKLAVATEKDETKAEAAKARADAAADAAKRASVDWKLEKVVPALNLRGVFLAGPGAVERAVRFQAANSGLKVLPVIRFGEDAPDVPHAVAMSPEEFAKHASEVAYPVLRAARMDLATIETAREKLDGNYLVARVRVAK